MSEMIERVAKALCQVDGFNPDEVGGDSFDDGLVHWKAYEVEARAAIKAMRDMIDEALK